jgi:hypothetical protein
MSTLLDRLDQATDRAVDILVQRSMPVQLSRKSVLVGNSFIRRNDLGLYDVFSISRHKLYSDISVFDVAIIVAQNHNIQKFSNVKRVLALEGKFSKFRTDMMYYLHAMTGAKKNNDFERLAILEDRFTVAESSARNIRDSISFFKKAK